MIDFSDGDGDNSSEFDVLDVIGTGGETDGSAAFVLLRVASTSSTGLPLPDPLPFASRLPTPAHGRLVFAAGYPMSDARVPRDVQVRTFGEVYGVKRVLPGQVLAVAGRVFHHDCLTLVGNGGSPVVGLVLGFHYAGEWLEYKRGVATSMWELRDDPRLSGVGVRYEEPGVRRDV